MSGPRKMKGAEIVLSVLKERGVEVVFGYPGGAVLPIYDEIFGDNNLRHVLVRHEQGALHAAEGYAKSTGKVGVALVTSGPGATNAVTGLTDALMDSVPLLCLSGQVPTHLIGTDAFQECDTCGITRPCTKYNVLVKDVDKLAETLHDAFDIALSKRPGPVLVDIPKDVQFAEGIYKGEGERTSRVAGRGLEVDRGLVDEAVRLIRKSRKPVVYGGGGLVSGGDRAKHELRRFVELTSFPTTLTLMGLGVLPASHPLFLGMLGMHGTYEANMAMHDCDLMLAFGSRFDDRVTGRLDAFSPDSKKVHVDVDASSINKNVLVDVGIEGEVGEVLGLINDALEEEGLDRGLIRGWLNEVEMWRSRNSLGYKRDGELIKPQYAVERLYALSRDRETYITTEVGQHQMWAAQHYPFEEPRRWLTSGGLGTMGFGFPAALGAQMAHPDALVVDIAGESSFMMVLQELSTAKQYGLPVKILILNNEYLGMVRQWQELLHGGRYSESYCSSLPDFVKLAESFGGLGLRAKKPSEVDGVIKEMIETDNVVIADICIDPNENCFPMIPSGAAHNEMIFGDGEAEISEEGRRLV